MIPRLPVPVEVDPVELPGAPTTGAAGELARSIIDRLEDVRIGVALLQGAAAQADLTIDASPYAASAPTRAWAKPALAAVQPLRRIIAACAEFEDVFCKGKV